MSFRQATNLGSDASAANATSLVSTVSQTVTTVSENYFYFLVMYYKSKVPSASVKMLKMHFVR